MLQMYFGWVGVVLGHFLFLMKQHTAHILYNVRKKIGRKEGDRAKQSQHKANLCSCPRVYVNSQKLASESIKMQKMMLSGG